MTARRSAPRSIRAHLLGIVVVGAILPLAMIGAWLTWSAVRSGKDLLDRQLSGSLQSMKQSIAARWQDRRGDLLLLADNESARHIVSLDAVSAADSQYFAAVGSAVNQTIPAFSYHDVAGREIYTSVGPQDTTHRATVMHVSYPVRAAGAVVGRMDADVYLGAVLPADSARLLLPGSTLALQDRVHHAALIPFSDGEDFPVGHDVSVHGAVWLAEIDSSRDPPVDLAVAAPVAPYVTPFERAGRLGLMALGVVALIAILLSNFLTARLARSLAGLVDAADAVAGGDLTGEARPSGPIEFRRLAGSFNTMTGSLRRLVAELSQRRALAAVGEFAASLSHEVRNALTSVQIDLERVDERTEDAKNRALVARALTQVRRLDAAVTGSLRIARSGNMVANDVQLGEVLQQAIRVAEPSFIAVGARITVAEVDAALIVRGDGDALHQLFLNLLLNAQQSLAAGGETVVSVNRADGRVVVSVADTGCGMSDDQIARAFDLYYTTRSKGTGLGLPIARQIAIAHGGELQIRSEVGGGTTVDVSLPCSAPTL